jgi:hypothetical protein
VEDRHRFISDKPIKCDNCNRDDLTL